MLIAYKYRMYPNNEQCLYLNKMFGCSRFIYNKMLGDKIKHYESNKEMLKNSYAQYKDEFTWLKDADARALSYTQLNLNKAYTNFFKRPEVGFPKFKSKYKNRMSFTTDGVKLENGRVKIPKLKSWISIVEHRQFNGTIKSCTISKTPSGKYYISMLIDTPDIKYLDSNNNSIGIDLGIKEFAVCSNGYRIENPKYLRKSEKRLKKLQKQLSKKVKGSKNRNKARFKVAKLHEKVANQRKDFLHKESTKIIKENNKIVIEDLAVKNMVKNHKLAKSVQDVGWGMFREMLSYKAEWNSRNLVVADRFFPSSQLCSKCTNRNTGVKDLSIRTWICNVCGFEHDRDLNAAQNLENYTK